jgi:tetratricopeptide (TPR) repeat protein
MGRILRDRADLGQAEKSLLQAVNILEKIIPGSGDHRVLSNLGIAYNRLADVYRLQGKDAIAVVTYSRTAPIAERLLAQDPLNAMALSMRAESLSRAAAIQESNGDWAAALRSYQEAAQMDARQSSRDPGDLRARENLAGSHYRICEIRYRLLQYAQAFEACAAAIAQWKQTPAKGDLALALLRAGDVRMAQAAEEPGKAEWKQEGCRWYRDAAATATTGAFAQELEQRLAKCAAPPR